MSRKIYILVPALLVIMFVLVITLARASEPLNLLWPVKNHSVQGTFEPSHYGIDIINTEQRTGALIYAAESGTVIYRQVDSTGLGGKLIKLDHGVIDDIHYYTWYAHLSEYKVSLNEEVSKGQIIGVMGCTGTCYGTHLHFQLMKNASTMPQDGTCADCLNPVLYLSGDPSAFVISPSTVGSLSRSI